MTPVAVEKRALLQRFIDELLSHHPAVQGVVGIGSIATGNVRPDSDIDAVLFLDPFDWYIVPAEFIWLPDDCSFHSIFTPAEELAEPGMQFDLRRLDLKAYADPGFEWPEGQRYDLGHGWLAYDRHGQIAPLIAEKCTYDQTVRLGRLDEALIWMDQHLANTSAETRWNSLGPTIAFDRLQAAYRYLVQALFAYNNSWMPWRNREMEALLQLAWLPTDFAAQVLSAANAPSLDHAGYLAQAEVLRSMFEQLLERLIADGLYDPMPVEQAFIRQNDEPGFAWNMDDWNQIALSRAIALVKQRDAS